jgi:hypothetical protein
MAIQPVVKFDLSSGRAGGEIGGNVIDTQAHGNPHAGCDAAYIGFSERGFTNFDGLGQRKVACSAVPRFRGSFFPRAIKVGI